MGQWEDGRREAAKPLVAIPCEALTKKKKPCPNNAHQLDGAGKWMCHVHNNTMLFRQQIVARRDDRATGLIPRRVRRNARVTPRNGASREVTVGNVSSRRDALTPADRQQTSAPVNTSQPKSTRRPQESTVSTDRLPNGLSIRPRVTLHIPTTAEREAERDPAPKDGAKYFGIHLPLNIGPEVGKALDERKYGHRGRKP